MFPIKLAVLLVLRGNLSFDNEFFGDYILVVYN